MQKVFLTAQNHLAEGTFHFVCFCLEKFNLLFVKSKKKCIYNILNRFIKKSIMKAYRVLQLNVEDPHEVIVAATRQLESFSAWSEFEFVDAIVMSL